MVERDYRIYVGIDWASEAHQACVLNHERGIVAERSFAHAGNAVAEFAQWLLVSGRSVRSGPLLQQAVVVKRGVSGAHASAGEPRALEASAPSSAISLSESGRPDVAQHRAPPSGESVFLASVFLQPRCRPQARAEKNSFDIALVTSAPLRGTPWMYALMQMSRFGQHSDSSALDSHDEESALSSFHFCLEHKIEIPS